MVAWANPGRSTRPEEVMNNEKRMSNGQRLITFPSQPSPHSMLMIFRKHDMTRMGKGNLPILNEASTTSIFNGGGYPGDRKNYPETSGFDAIELPFPKQLVDNNSLRTESINQGAIAGSIAKYLSNKGVGSEGGPAIELANLGGGLQKLGAGLVDLISNGANTTTLANTLNEMFSMNLNSGQSAAAGKYLLRNILPESVANQVDLQTGTIVNPKETLAFDGVDLKTHSFNWELFPQEQRDSDVIRRIVQRIKKHSLPGVENFAGLERVLLSYPSTVDIFLIGVNQEYFVKFKTCMITSFSVDYGATGTVPIMKGGKPGNVNLSIELSELEIHTSNDYDYDLQDDVAQDPVEDIINNGLPNPI